MLVPFSTYVSSIFCFILYRQCFTCFSLVTGKYCKTSPSACYSLQQNSILFVSVALGRFVSRCIFHYTARRNFSLQSLSCVRHGRQFSPRHFRRLLLRSCPAPPGCYFTTNLYLSSPRFPFHSRRLQVTLLSFFQFV